MSWLSSHPRPYELLRPSSFGGRGRWLGDSLLALALVLRSGLTGELILQSAIWTNTELARGRDDAKQILAAARIMRSVFIVVADMNGDAVPDIDVLLPGDGRDITRLRGLRDAQGLRWVAPAIARGTLLPRSAPSGH